jgi:hypothetical protein
MESWRFLESKPYGTPMWDLAVVSGAKAVVFMIRESGKDAEALPGRLPVLWRAGLLGEGRAMPLLVVAHIPHLAGYYEFWFNFHGREGPFVEEALSLLGAQPLLILNVHDRGPKPVRAFAFPNRMGDFFRGARKALAESAPWEDRDFEEAKASLQRRHSPEGLFRLLGG